MDALRRADLDEARATPPGVKLEQALALMKQGLEMKRRKLRADDPSASEEEIDARMLAWMSAPR